MCQRNFQKNYQTQIQLSSICESINPDLRTTATTQPSSSSFSSSTNKADEHRYFWREVEGENTADRQKERDKIVFNYCKCSKFNKCHASPYGWLRMGRASIDGSLSPKLQTRLLNLPDG
jgi:hypothetical protein